ncbi:hypothetical protein BZA05DRAFT_397757 [Tricharina praecox]|uniref:uncharacterized protein n=1 Tax=Tricharina praecox TaxID=43433 RepID=UPI002221290F|nr:uncharacterized protein BZA05DRAFT_397757 [Tricharina praecox]KAI5852388.1 hypothetical protein BZA05DRAFT_397757 [Tricharina praecox]
MASLLPSTSWSVGDSGFNDRQHSESQGPESLLRRLLVNVGNRVAHITGADKSEVYKLMKAMADELYHEQLLARPAAMQSQLAQSVARQHTATTTTAMGVDGECYPGTINPHILQREQVEIIQMALTGNTFDGTVDVSQYSGGQSGYARPLVAYERSHPALLERHLADIVGTIDGASRPAGSGQGNDLTLGERQSFRRGTRRLRDPGEDLDSAADYSNSESNLDPQLQLTSRTHFDPYIPGDARSIEPSTSKNMGPPSSFTSLSLSQQSPGYRQCKRTKTVASEPINETETSSQAGGDRNRGPSRAPGPSEHGNETETSSQAGQDRTCDSCSRHFPFPRDLKAHIQAHHAGGIKCDECSACLSNQYSLQRHKASKHGVGRHCGHCPTTFGTLTALSKHMAKEHGVGEHCNFCDCAVTKLDRHLADHHGQGHACRTCPRFFATEHSARHHRKNCVGNQLQNQLQQQPRQQHGQQQRDRRHPSPEQQQNHHHHSLYLDPPGYQDMFF